jgi:hypothetical protein
MSNKITDQAHWDSYWSNYQFENVPKKVVFNKYTDYAKGKVL